jgi:hypothetical protein
VLLICRHPPSPPRVARDRDRRHVWLLKTDNCEHEKTLCVSKMRIEV